MSQDTKSGLLSLPLSGRIDSGSAPALEAEISSALDAAPGASRLVFDAERLEYISSAGLRVLMRLLKRPGTSVAVENVSPEVYEVFQATGFTELMEVRRRPREISVEGCEIIGRGAYGTVYRIDPDTVVKVYEIPGAVEIIRNEHRMAKCAFLKGIPTPISFDIVRVGQWYGSMFELVNARTLNDLFIEQPPRRAELLRTHANIMRQVHGAEMSPGDLPDARALYRQQLDAVRPLLPEDVSAKLEALLAAMPEDLHLIHGDFHMKNIMLSEGEPLLIDMETLSTGDPVFDFAGLSVAYELFNEDEPDNSQRFLGLPKAVCDTIVPSLLKDYLPSPDEALLEEAGHRIRIAAWLRFLYLVYTRDAGGAPLKEQRIRHAVQALGGMLSQTDALALRPLLAERS